MFEWTEHTKSIYNNFHFVKNTAGQVPVCGRVISFFWSEELSMPWIIHYRLISVCLLNYSRFTGFEL